MGSPLSPVGRCGGCVPPGLRRTLGHYGGWQVHPHVLPKRPSLFSWRLRLPLGARPPSSASTSGEAASPSSAGRGRVGWQPRSRLGRCGRGVPAVRLNFSRSLCLGSRPPPRPKRRGAGAVRVRILAVPMPAPAHVSCVHPCAYPRRRPRLRPGMRPYTRPRMRPRTRPSTFPCMRPRRRPCLPPGRHPWTCPGTPPVGNLVGLTRPPDAGRMGAHCSSPLCAPYVRVWHGAGGSALLLTPFVPRTVRAT